MAFSAAFVSRVTTRLVAPGALTTAALAYASERGTARASQQAVSTASREFRTALLASSRVSSSVSASKSTFALPRNYQNSTFRQSRSFASSSSSTTTSNTAKNATKTATTSSTTTTSTTTTAAKPFSFVEWYEGHLQAHPIPTKMVTGSILWSLGDAVAQIVPSAAAGTLDWSTFRYDWTRTGRAFAFGFVLHAPASHAHFNFLEWMTVRAGVTGYNIPIFKAFMEQFVYWS